MISNMMDISYFKNNKTHNFVEMLIIFLLAYNNKNRGQTQIINFNHYKTNIIINKLKRREVIHVNRKGLFTCIRCC